MLNRIKAILIFACMLLVLCACGNEEKTGTGKTCKISIDCKTILNNTDSVDEEILDIVPEDGVILATIDVELYDNDTVFDVLKSVCKDNKIAMEFNDTFGSKYVEGIGGIYEFDAGGESGWQYSVNGEYPMKSCSEYQVKEGDEICWRYTCKLGEDLYD